MWRYPAAVTEPAEQDGYLRIGSPPKGDPKTPPKRSGPPLVVLVAGSLLLAAAAVAVIFINGRAPVVAGPSPTPSLARLDKQATCVLLIPALTDAVRQVTAIAEKPDGTTVNWERVKTLIMDLKLLRDTGAPEFSEEIGQHVPTLQQMLDLYMGLDVSSMLSLDTFRASGMRLTAQCAQYATG